MGLRKDTYQRVSDFLYEFSKDFGEPVNFEGEMAKLKDYEKSSEIRQQKFYFLVDLKKQKITWSMNIHRYLPFADIGQQGNQELTLYNFFSCIHDNFLDIYFGFGLASYRLLRKVSSETILNAGHLYKVQLPIKLKDGRYHWVMQQSYPFLVDKDNNLVAHLNEYIILDEYSDQLMQRPMVVFSDQRRKDLEADLGEQVEIGLILAGFFGFTQRELQLMRLYCQDEDINISTAAKTMEIAEDTVKTHNRHILNKISDLFPDQFTSARQVAVYIKRLFGKF